jgi:hypothetical protein
MTLCCSAKAGVVWLWEISALRVRKVLSRMTEGRRNQVGHAYLLQPRCCRTEQYWESR